MEMNRNRGIPLYVTVWIVLIVSTTGLILIIAGYVSFLHLQSPVSRAIICVGFFVWGFLYWLVSATRWRIAFGLAQIGFALVSDWYQLSKLAVQGASQRPYERLAFIIAGIAFVAHGCKDVGKGLRQWRKKSDADLARIAEALKRLPNESSGTPGPARPSRSAGS